MTDGSAATTPERGTVPEAVSPPPEYAVAVNSVAAPGGSWAGGGERRTGWPQPANPVAAAQQTRPTTICWPSADICVSTDHCPRRRVHLNPSERISYSAAATAFATNGVSTAKKLTRGR